jgi:hypothetical protein
MQMQIGAQRCDDVNVRCSCVCVSIEGLMIMIKEALKTGCLETAQGDSPLYLGYI